MRRITLVLAMAAVLVGCSQPRNSKPKSGEERDLPNLIYNSSFETLVYPAAFAAPDLVKVAGGDYIRQFEYWPQNRNGMQIETARAHSGKNSLLVVGPANGYIHNEVGYYVYNTGPGTVLLPQTKYRLSGWVKTENITGKGLNLSVGGGMAGTEWVNGTKNWKKLSAEFTTPARERGFVGGSVRLEWQLKEGDKGWFDDIRLEPVNGQVPPAPAPAITPNGGTHQGPLMVALKTNLPGAVIQYTVDGSEPHRFSVLYRGPFRIDGNVTVRAKVFHTAFTEAESRAEFTILPLAYNLKSDSAHPQSTIRNPQSIGVPFYPTGWGMDVEDWYENHPYNPKNPRGFNGPVASPARRFDMAEVIKAHPDTKTAGIAEALAEAPAEGATFFFPKAGGPYVISQSVPITRSSLHFLSDGAVIQIQGRAGLRFNAPGSFGQKWKDSFVLDQITNFYFQNLIFDGGGTAPSVFSFQGSKEILVDNCTFRRFDSKKAGNLISANVNTDNFWYRNCTWEENTTGFGCYWDGVHNGGILNCRFVKNDFGGGNFLIFSNNDMSPFCAFQRSGQYIVFDGCYFEGPGHNVMSITTANALVANCTVTGAWNAFVSQNGRGKSNTQPRMFFDGGGLEISNNKVDGAKTFLQLVGDTCQRNRPAEHMDIVVSDNVATGCEAFLTWAPTVDPHYPPYARLGAVTIRNNTFAGENRPRMILYTSGNKIEKITVGDKQQDVEVKDPTALSRIGPVKLVGNTLTGAPRPILVDHAGQALKHKNITIK